MKSRYVRQIIKRLECSGARKQEIKRQVSADILAGIEAGEKEEDIVKRMGSPAEIAEEFNRSFPDSERKKYKRERRGKAAAAAALAVLALLAVFYWLIPKQKPVENSKLFQEEKVAEQAKQVIRLLDSEDYPALQEISNEAMKQAMTKAQFDQAKQNFVPDWGGFRSFGNCYIAEVEQQGIKFAVAQLGASYENTSVTYTISFDEEMRLAGLYMK